MKKILIVDDQPQVRELIAVSLQTGDYQLFLAENAEQALQLAQKELPHLILLDVMLYGSELDGLQVCRYLKNNPATQAIPIILLTASGQKNNVEAGMAAGADDYIIKPFSPFALAQKIETMVG
ncbi:MAG: response regulator [Anaerolineales bacterium]|nr:response regulator [Anaerolineales bacterium]